jgi:transposase
MWTGVPGLTYRTCSARRRFGIPVDKSARPFIAPRTSNKSNPAPRYMEYMGDGITAYCRPENKVALGFVEGLNNKIRVIQRRAYGLHDEEYLRLKVLTCTLPAH